MYAYPMSPIESTYCAQKMSLTRLEEIERAAVTKMEDEYADEIAAHTKELEMLAIPDVNMIDLQPEIQWHMRPYLLDFLIESHLSLHLQPQTLYLAINLIDRYCSRRVVYKRHYQLVGCAALWIASKYEDKKDHVPSVRELKIMCCNAYEEDMFVQMEGHVLHTLDWSIGVPTSETYLRQLTQNSCSSTLQHLASYLCEVSMYSRSMLSFPASVMASAAYIVAQHILCHSPGQRPFNLPTPASEEESKCVVLLSQHLHTASESLAHKYSSSKFSQVALILQDFLVRQHRAAASAPPTPPLSSAGSDVRETVPSIPAMDKNSMSSARYGYLTPPTTPDGTDLPGEKYPPVA
ncbi:cyclin-like protein [Dipodascopsis tothii]|uniref:cyclin-like protein n=1 Tax=Dipodascopsis tothii TaxID=44089 RepID=UPI0034CEF95F